VAGRPAAAAEAYRAALRAHPRLPQAHLGLGRALLDLRDAAGAAAALAAAVEVDRRAAEHGVEPLLDDPDEDPHYLLGMAEHLRGDLAAAVAHYERSAARFPSFAEPLLEIARCRLARGERDLAAAACERILSRRRRPSVAEEARALLAEARRPG